MCTIPRRGNLLHLYFKRIVTVINHLRIRNFKSIEDISIPSCKRVNVFIGEPNSGKSNILEALTFFSANSFETDKFKDFFRIKNVSDFFFDGNTNNEIEIYTDILNFKLGYSKSDNGTLHNSFRGAIYSPAEMGKFSHGKFPNATNSLENILLFSINFDGNISHVENKNSTTPFRTYIFKPRTEFRQHFTPILNPPFGDNIPSLLIANKDFKDLVSKIVQDKGFRLLIKPVDQTIEIAKIVDDNIYSYPYGSISETLQRIVFYCLVIETNKKACLVLDEPDANTFPLYTKQLAELIALDATNQYFIATHNPYLLGSIVSRTPVNQLSVFITKMVDFKTKIFEVPGEKLSEILDGGQDVFFNLDKFSES
ncbi:MAG: recombination protein F [Bacteroidetes bacterium ADurb.Bin397]|nr:MAG: recombination protein F [Bacteroidetes bacterium ADurb.Bin397]